MTSSRNDNAHAMTYSDSRREVLLVIHPDRATTGDAARAVARRFTAAGICLRVIDRDMRELIKADHPEAVCTVAAPEDNPARGVEIVFVLGGDGTLLRGAELARAAGVPVLGVNLGRVGFLTEADSDALVDTVQRFVDRLYRVERRMTLDVSVSVRGEIVERTWALNEASIEKSGHDRILDARIEIDGRPVSSFGCDGVLCATPTGSTAYAFSAGGPVMWPDVEALLVVPSNAHAMFARPLVVSRQSLITVRINPYGTSGVLTCDGLRHAQLPANAEISVVAGTVPVFLARLKDETFTDRLVQKFSLPVKSWRDQ